MARTPCCENMGLKKGPWTPEEDQILISYIRQFGHGNWRALPKQAGLMRCGKSCRLRWINYLRPDVKRGNFTKEEEESILYLHSILGNRWSAIAARLPGRTDNEIKNFWHTHLKKRITEHSLSPNSSNKTLLNQSPYRYINEHPGSFLTSTNYANIHQLHSPQYAAVVPPDQHTQDSSLGSSEISSPTCQFSKPEFHLNRTAVGGTMYESSSRNCENRFPWSSLVTSGKFPCHTTCSKVEDANQIGLVDKDGLDFWYNLFIKTGENS